MPIQYGRVITEEVFYNFESVNKICTYKETVYADSDKDVLATFLTMLDKRKTGELPPTMGINLVNDKKTGNLRIEKTWVIPESK